MDVLGEVTNKFSKVLLFLKKQNKTKQNKQTKTAINVIL